MATIYLTKDVTVNVSAIGEHLMLVWIFIHHDYEEAYIGNVRIKMNWYPCSDGDYYRNNEHGEYLYDVSYPDAEGNCIELKNIEIDESSIVEQLKANIASVDYDNYANGYLAGAKYNYFEQNVKGYTDKKVTKLSAFVSNPVHGQAPLTIYFRCNHEGKTSVLSPVVAFHSNIIYTDIEYIGMDEDDMEVFNIKSKADEGYVIRLNVDYDDILSCEASRMKIHNGMLTHEHN